MLALWSPCSSRLLLCRNVLVESVYEERDMLMQLFDVQVAAGWVEVLDEPEQSRTCYGKVRDTETCSARSWRRWDRIWYACQASCHRCSSRKLTFSLLSLQTLLLGLRE